MLTEAQRIAKRESKRKQRERRREREKGLTRNEVYALRRANAIKYNSGEAVDALAKKRRGVIRASTRRKRLIQISGCQNHRCCYCGQQTWHPDIIDCGIIPHTKWNLATSEHVVAQNNGGTWGRHNIVMACAECNSSRGSKAVKKFIALITSDIKKKPSKKEMRSLKKEEKRKTDKGQLKKFKTIRLLWVALSFYPELFAIVQEEAKDMTFKHNLKTNKRCQVTAIRWRVIENQMVY